MLRKLCGSWCLYITAVIAFLPVEQVSDACYDCNCGYCTDAKTNKYCLVLSHQFQIVSCKFKVLFIENAQTKQDIDSLMTLSYRIKDSFRAPRSAPENPNVGMFVLEDHTRMDYGWK